MSDDKTQFSIFPGERLHTNFPIQIWLIGWIAFLKSTLWLFLPTLTPSAFLFPFFILFGIGVWNLRQWAWWGIFILSCLDIILFFIFPSFPLPPIKSGPVYMSLVNLLMSPFGDILTIFLLFLSRRFFQQKE